MFNVVLPSQALIYNDSKMSTTMHSFEWDSIDMLINHLILYALPLCPAKLIQFSQHCFG